MCLTMSKRSLWLFTLHKMLDCSAYEYVLHQWELFPKQYIGARSDGAMWGVGRAHGLFTAVGSGGQLVVVAPPQIGQITAMRQHRPGSKPPISAPCVTSPDVTLWPEWPVNVTTQVATHVTFQLLFTHLFTRWRPSSVRSVHKHVIQVCSPVWLVPHWLHWCTATAQRALGSAEWSTGSKVRPSWARQQLPRSCWSWGDEGPSWARSMWP